MTLNPMGWLRTAAALCGIALAAFTLPAVAADGAAADPAATWRQLEAEGVRIGQVHVVVGDIFDLADPREDKALFRLANALHYRTRPHVIERALLFAAGDKVSARLMEETERLLRRNRYLYDVQIVPAHRHGDEVDVEVRTRDTWSLDPGLSAGRSGGKNSSGLGIKDYNVLGTGTTLSYARANNVDRSTNEFSFYNDQAFGTRTAVGLTLGNNSDGRRNALSVVQPFYALDSRWTAGFSVLRDDRLDPVYDSGELVEEFRHQQNRYEVFGGWSDGLVDGWVRRTSVGLRWSEDRYGFEPGRTAPAALPGGEKLTVPFVRYEVIENQVERLENRNLMARPEFFDTGLLARAEFGLASRHMGSSTSALLFDAAVSRGFEPAPAQSLIAAISTSGRIASGGLRRVTLGGTLQYFAPRTSHRVFYVGASAHGLFRPEPTETLLLGGDSGLRGYPLRYQNGNRRLLLTVEERFFTDVYPWRLFRIGGAVFADVGRAWGGDARNTVNPGWLSDVGMGLRIVSTRAAFSNVLHIDVAMPLQAKGDIRQLQLLVKTRASF